MRLYKVGQARPAYYDRNPTASGAVYVGVGVAPHAATQRAIYTVPANRKAYVEELMLVYLRSTLAAGIGVVELFSVYTPNGGSGLRAADLFGESVSVGDKGQYTVGSYGLMVAGDTLELYTSDTSTGGAVEYREHFKYTEFAA